MRRGLLAGTVLVAGGGALIAGAIPAGASNSSVTAAGSFTTFDVMNALFPASLNNTTPGKAGTMIKADLYCTAGANITAPNGSSAGKDALKAEELAGITAQGCITFARSSSPPKKGTSHTSVNFDYYAYALDGVAPMVGTDANAKRDQITSTPATWVTLTVTDMRHIYHCDAGYLQFGGTGAGGANLKTAFPNGTGGTIFRLWPQTGSGTRSVYKDILGFTPAVAATKGSCANPATTSFTVTGTPKVNEENTESGIIFSGHVANAIYIYSAGKFAQEWNTPATFGPTKKNSVSTTTTGNFIRTNPTTTVFGPLLANVHNTSTNGSTDFVTFTTSTGYALNASVITEGNEWYSHVLSNTGPAKTSSAPVAGVRYIYNVADDHLPSYNGAKMMIGFDNQSNGAKSVLCDPTGTIKNTTPVSKVANVIRAQGFIPLARTGGPTGANAAHSTCREFAGNNYPGKAAAAKHWTP